MTHRTFADKIAYYYTSGYWDIVRLDAALARRKITQEEYDAIIAPPLVDTGDIEDEPTE